MTDFKRWIAVLALCLGGAASALPAAAEDSKLEKAREVFRVMQADTLIDQIFDAAFAQMGGMMSQKNPEMPPEAMAIIQDEVKISLKEAMPALLDQMAVVYGEVFTEAELDGMLAFYTSPVGQSLVAKTPEVTARSMQFSQTWAIGLFQGLPQRIEKRLKAEGYDL
jgi:uncharacterized protein